MLQRGPIVDLLVGEDECLVLLEDQCLRLTAVAAAVVQLLDRPRTSADIEARLEAEFGPAPGGRFEEIVTSLVDQGLVQAPDQVLSGDS